MFSTLFCVNAVCHWFIKLLSDLICRDQCCHLANNSKLMLSHWKRITGEGKNLSKIGEEVPHRHPKSNKFFLGLQSHPKQFHSWKSVSNFLRYFVRRRKDRQTHKPLWKHNLLDEGNKPRLLLLLHQVKEFRRSGYEASSLLSCPSLFRVWRARGNLEESWQLKSDTVYSGIGGITVVAAVLLRELV